MNCKPRDLAIIILAGAGSRNLIGSIVTVIKRARDRKQLAAVPYDMRACWHYKPKLKDSHGRTVKVMNDCCLRPIRPGDISDAEVRELYADKPSEVTA